MPCIKFKPLLLTSFFFFSLATTTTAAAAAVAKPGCQAKCGNLTIPYPFGLSSACSASSNYHLTCNTSNNSPITFLSTPTGPLEVVNITDSQLLVRNQVAYMCQDSSGNITSDHSVKNLSLNHPCTISRKNMFTVIGCNFFGVMYWPEGTLTYISGCGDKSAIQPDSCYGAGCTTNPIPPGLTTVNITVSQLSSVLNFTLGIDPIGPCGYTFFADSDKFKFNGLNDVDDPKYLDRVIRDFPLVLDWAIGQRNCSEAKKDSSNEFACQMNSECFDSDDQGYNCRCINGYTGNPYLGCTDIDECIDPKINDCSESGICTNTPGSYNCSCLPEFMGNGRKGGGCFPRASRSLALKLSLGISIGMVVLLLILSWIYFTLRKRRLLKMKERFFEQNGGLMLQQLLMIKQGGIETTKIFTIEELNDATNDFSEDYILGKGGHGCVYKGILPNNQVVAIKKSKFVNANEIEEFINEMVILMQVNHRNVVKLLGCCLETEVPLLVSEYIPNGTLYDLIHGRLSYISWKNRLRIATEAANALAYLHSSTSIPIVHRDVKSNNILLDKNDTAKIADFGASRLIPLDQTQLTTLVQGTLGYLDPEYFYSSQLTAKSDVYSFGVVLAELLTKQKPLSSDRSIEMRNLAIYFVSSMEEDHLCEVLDPDLVQEASLEELKCLAELVKRCLGVKGDDRPMMKEIAIELERLWKFSKNHSLEFGGNPFIRKHHVGESGNYEQNMSQDMMNDMTLPR